MKKWFRWMRGVASSSSPKIKPRRQAENSPVSCDDDLPSTSSAAAARASTMNQQGADWDMEAGLHGNGSNMGIGAGLMPDDAVGGSELAIVQVKTAKGRNITVTQTGLREGAFSMTPEHLQQRLREQQLREEAAKLTLAKLPMAAAMTEHAQRPNAPRHVMASTTSSKESTASDAAIAGSTPAGSNSGQSRSQELPARSADSFAKFLQAQNPFAAMHAQPPFDVPMGPVVIRLLGDPKTGKTAIVRSFSYAETSPFTPLPKKKLLPYNSRVRMQIMGAETEMQIWDQSIFNIPTGPTFNQIKKAILSGMKGHDNIKMHAFVVCYSTVDRKSFENAKEKWVTMAMQTNNSHPIFLLGTKMDLRDELSGIIRTGDKKPAEQQVVINQLLPIWIPAVEGGIAKRDGPFIGFQECSAYYNRQAFLSLQEAFHLIAWTTTRYYVNLIKYVWSTERSMKAITDDSKANPAFFSLQL